MCRYAFDDCEKILKGKAINYSIGETVIRVYSSKLTVVDGSSQSIGRLLILSMLLVGSGMQAYANGTLDALLVAYFLLIAGIAAVILFFQSKWHEMRAFLITYAVCLFVGGLAQCYSLAFFDNPQPPFMTMEEMPLHNSPLAVIIWQQVYKVTWWMGFEFGPYIGVMFNAMVMGLLASLTVRTARELFGNDDRKLNRVINLFAFNGLLILFGAVLIRDCFTTALNTLVLWGLIRCLLRTTLRKMLLVIVLVGVTSYAMFYLRANAIPLLALNVFLAFLGWFLAKRLNTKSLLIAILSLFVLFIVMPYISSYFEATKEIQVSGMENYTKMSAGSHSATSLGMRFVVNQPLPIRMVMGSAVLMISPIPLWAYFNSDSEDYLWIKSYNGFYQLLFVPFIVAGFPEAFRLIRENRKQAPALLFLMIYLVVNLLAVVGTSGEQRHLAQFMPAFVIIAALPDTLIDKAKKRLRTIVRWWIGSVVLVHLAWIVLKST